MKRQIRKLLGLPSLALLTFLGFSGIAQAYTCATVPSSVSGDVDITESGACTINHPLTASGHIHITAGSSITAQDLSAQTEVDLTASTDITITGAVNANFSYVRIQGNNINASGAISTTSFGNILLLAQGNLATGAITSAPGYNIDLKANIAGGNTPFVIGGTGQSNGTNGAITAQPLGNNPNFASALIYVTNGNANSTGGLTLSDPSKISVAASGTSRTGYIYLNAQKGTLSIPTGPISLDGANGAGLIGLLAKTVAFGPNVTISAVQPVGVAGTLHGIGIAAETVTFSGSSGLTLRADGDGSAQYNNGYVQHVPMGGITVNDPMDPLALSIYGVFNTTTGNVTYTGSGTAPLVVSANGTHNLVAFFGNTITFNGGAITLSSRGVTDHTVMLQNPSPTGIVGLAINGTGAVKLDTSALVPTGGSTATGGDIKLYLDKVSFNKPVTYTITANGPTDKDGDGGTVYISANLLTLNPSGKVTITANASSFGNGNAVLGDVNANVPKAIQLFAGSTSLDIGTATGQFSLAAKGGKTGGNGGTVVVSSAPVNIQTASAINASALAGTGNAGEIFFYSYIQNVDPAATMTAIGKGSGTGGKFTANSAALGADVNKFIKVDGGSTVGANFNGSIELNGITCQQRKTTSASVWPKTYWNCVNTGTAAESTIDKAIGDVIITKLSSTARTPIGTRVYIYEFVDFAALQSFTAQTFADQVAGATFAASGTTPNIYSAVTAPATRTEPTMRELTLHEIGHAFDIFYNRESADSGNYGKYVANDFLKLDYIQVDPLSQTNSVKRLPCAPTPNPAGGFFPDAPPFANVSLVCNGTVPRAPFNDGRLNHGILQDPSIAAYFFTQTNGNWDQLYAQALAYQGYVATSGQPFAYVAVDSVFASGQFSCVRAWADLVKAGPPPRSTTAACTAAVPTWYGF